MLEPDGDVVVRGVPRLRLATFDLNLLKAADALLLERSVTRAAERVGVTQQAMSGQLRRLREVFGDPILVQRGRALLPTALGEALASPVRDVLLRAERALVIAPDADLSRSRRMFSVATSAYVRTTLMPTASAVLARAAPLAGIATRQSGAFLNDLRDGRIDLCCVADGWRSDAAGTLRDVMAETLLYDEYVCVTDAGALADGMDLETYLAGRHVVVDAPAGATSPVRRAWIDAGATPAVAISQPTATDVLLTLPGTGTIGTVQRRLAERWAPVLGLSVYPTPIAIDPVKVDMIWHSRDEVDPAHALLREAIREAARMIEAGEMAIGGEAPIIICGSQSEPA